jgi:hypothetical protein
MLICLLKAYCIDIWSSPYPGFFLSKAWIKLNKFRANCGEMISAGNPVESMDSENMP